ncbi:hypothetical protein GCM10011348_07490 [Marinobacterium nitratireducens]|uniref:Uncharacterized protein n=1 Tax=Marinobacterium nitratireducens TaxID=518897 RepID=A0A917ZAN9_9GAMM|nr:hypothetical protein [Marinobacterium nitratireducens]GGO77590.1 hypothetical protein GCM10011348_07490 [Marinobacterium nitratireducens]
MTHILNFLDGIFGRAASWSLTAVLYLSLGLLALLCLGLTPYEIFEYGEGVSDLDLSELAILIVLPLVIWRYIWRCRQQGWSWWVLMRQLGFVVAIFALLSAEFWTLFAVIEGQPAGSDFMEHMELLRSPWIPLENLLLILCIYGAAPLPKLTAERLTKPEPETATDRVPPTVGTVNAWGVAEDDSTRQDKSQEANV